MAKAQQILAVVCAFILRITLIAADRYLDFLLRIRANERTVPPTRRIRFPDSTRQRIREQQGNLCMHCGVRLGRKNFHVDHIYPAHHGGSNRVENLQATCAPCNIRKGVQTDSEFRARYRTLLRTPPAGRLPRPPQARIPQSRFREVTARTTQSASTRARRAAIFKTSRQKIASGSTITGVVAGAIWLIAMSMLFDDESEFGAYVAVFGGVAVGLVTGIGLMWRAKYTGRFDQ